MLIVGVGCVLCVFGWVYVLVLCVHSVQRMLVLCGWVSVWLGCVCVVCVELHVFGKCRLGVCVFVDCVGLCAGCVWLVMCAGSVCVCAEC